MSLARVFRDGQQDLIEADWAEVVVAEDMHSEVLTFYRTNDVAMNTGSPPRPEDEIVAEYRWNAIQGYVWQRDPEEVAAPAPEPGAAEEETSG